MSARFSVCSRILSLTDRHLTEAYGPAMRRLPSVAVAIIVMSVSSAFVVSPAGGSTGSAKIAHCLVGTWRDGHEQESTLWAGHKVKMHYSGGDVDHFFAKGVDKDTWAHSHVQHGKYAGSTLSETIRGKLTEHLQMTGKGRLRVTSGAWSKSSTNTYVYRGQHSVGYLNSVTAYTVRFRCTAKKLTYLNKKGKVVGSETRISRKP
jgi:hypothetical protein